MLCGIFLIWSISYVLELESLAFAWTKKVKIDDNANAKLSSLGSKNAKDRLILNFHVIGPLGQFDLVVAMFVLVLCVV